MQADVYPQGQKALAVFEQGMTPVLVRQFANLLLEQEKERPCWCALAMTRQVITTQPEASAVMCVHSERIKRPSAGTRRREYPDGAGNIPGVAGRN